MNILIRNLSHEAIENTVMLLNYKFDAVVFFGKKSFISEERINIESFIRKYCNIKQIDFIPFDLFDIDEGYKVIDNELTKYKDDNLFFDVTGDYGLIEAIFLKLGQERNISITSYDVWTRKIIEINKGNINIDNLVKQNIKINLEMYIEMIGGRIFERSSRDNYKMKLIKSEDLVSMTSIFEKYKVDWVRILSILQRVISKDSLTFSINRINGLINNKININFIKQFLNEFVNYKLITKLEDKYSFKNELIRSIFLDSGSLFEIYDYLIESKNADDCKISINLDWDGMDFDEKDNVYNEIDILKLNGYVFTFISCKAGKISKEFLYELESITRRFGGKYAKMELHTVQDISNTEINRAGLIGIEIKKI